MTDEKPDTFYCSFCGKADKEVKKLVAGPTVFICDECIVVCIEVLKDAKIITPPASIPMRLPCPSCGALHIDEGEFATKKHHTHACQACGLVWRPAIWSTVGVRFLPGFKKEESKA